MAQAPPLSAQVNIGAASRYNTGHARCGVICYRRRWRHWEPTHRSRSDFAFSSRSGDKGRLIGRKNSSHRPRAVRLHL